MYSIIMCQLLCWVHIWLFQLTPYNHDFRRRRLGLSVLGNCSIIRQLMAKSKFEYEFIFWLQDLMDSLKSHVNLNNVLHLKVPMWRSEFWSFLENLTLIFVETWAHFCDKCLSTMVWCSSSMTYAAGSHWSHQILLKKCICKSRDPWGDRFSMGRGLMQE